jgi:hypothetical protein
MGVLDGLWKVFGNFGILGEFQRRGVDVSTPKIGSRDGIKCFGGILGFHADLRRELERGNFKLDFFGVLLGVLRGSLEEGGQTVCILGV